MTKKRCVSIELGWRANLNANHSLDVALYHNEYEDVRVVIAQDPVCRNSGQPVPFCLPVDTVTVPYDFLNLGGIRIGGVEVNWQYRIADDLQLSTSYTYNNQDADRFGPLEGFENSVFLTPEHLLGLQLDWQVSDDVNVRFKHRYVGGFDETAIAKLVTGNRFLTHYHSHDVVAVWHWSDKIRFTFNARNLLQDSGTEWIPEFPGGQVSDNDERFSIGLDVTF